MFSILKNIFFQFSLSAVFYSNIESDLSTQQNLSRRRYELVFNAEQEFFLMAVVFFSKIFVVAQTPEIQLIVNAWCLHLLPNLSHKCTVKVWFKNFISSEFIHFNRYRKKEKNGWLSNVSFAFLRLWKWFNFIFGCCEFPIYKIRKVSISWISCEMQFIGVQRKTNACPREI